MFNKDQIKEIIKEKNSAFKVLVDTQNKLKKSCEKAAIFISGNYDEVMKKETEISTLKTLNTSLDDQVKMMEASIKQTEMIINPMSDESK